MSRGRELPRPVCACFARFVHAIGPHGRVVVSAAKNRESPRWTPDDDARLRDLYAAGSSRAQMAAALGRTVPAVAQRTATLGIRRSKTPDWSSLDVTQLVELLDEHVPYAEIGRRLNRTADAVKIYATRHLGYRLTTNTAAHPINQIAQIVFGTRHMAKTVAWWVERGWLRAHPSGVGHNIRVVEHDDLLEFLGNEHYWHLWSPERITDPALRDWATEERRGLTFLSLTEVGRRLCLSVAGVEQRIARGQLRAVKRGPNWRVRSDHCVDPVWTVAPMRRFTAEDDTFLRQHFGAATLKWIGEKLARHSSVIRERAMRLGLATVGRRDGAA